ncbi:MAG: enoyl-CoA hydratase-related protein [Thaumarchaeota archaeon]|nr:enoyl-CoA hydratase-related protein [Nitrososphaerota archaeon]
MATLEPTFNFVIYSVFPEKKYAKITLNRPEVLNALNVEIRKEILSALDLAEKNDSVRAVVLTGAGEKAFSAGADIKIFQSMTPFLALEYLKISKGAAERIENFPKPIIAAVNGFAIGGGLELAMSCDIIVASANAKLGQAEINVGAIPGVGGTQRLPRLIGIKKAKELIYTGDLIDAAEALKLGLLNHVFPNQDSMMTFVDQLIEKISSKSPLILRFAKESLNRSMTGLRDGLDYESTLFSFCFSTADQKEGATAFLEKRKPVFVGC